MRILWRGLSRLYLSVGIMEKQEQIEEMAKEIFNSGIAIRVSDLAYGLIDSDDHFHRLAKYLYTAGYRKAFTSDLASDTQKAYKEGYEKARKETARDIIKDLIGHRFAYYEIDEKCGTYRVLSDYVVDKEDVKFLEDKYGVEVEE